MQQALTVIWVKIWVTKYAVHRQTTQVQDSFNVIQRCGNNNDRMAAHKYACSPNLIDTHTHAHKHVQACTRMHTFLQWYRYINLNPTCINFLDMLRFVKFHRLSSKYIWLQQSQSQNIRAQCGKSERSCRPLSYFIGYHSVWFHRIHIPYVQCMSMT